MQQRCALEPPPALRPQSHLFRDQVGEQGDPLAVPTRIRALGVDHLGKGRGDVVKIILVDQRKVLGGFKRKYLLLQILRT